MDHSDRLVAAPGVVVKDWGEALSVAYAPDSNSTHLLTAEATAALAAVASHALGIAAQALDLDSTLIDGLRRSGLLRLQP